MDKPLRREVTVDGVAYTLTLDLDGFRLVEKGRRNGHALRWKDILNGDAALAQGLYASLAAGPTEKSAAKAKAQRARRQRRRSS